MHFDRGLAAHQVTMANFERKTIAGRTNYVLDGRALANGDELELRLRGNRDWIEVAVEGLPDRLAVTWTADDGHTLHATLPDDAEIRWV